MLLLIENTNTKHTHYRISSGLFTWTLAGVSSEGRDDLKLYILRKLVGAVGKDEQHNSTWGEHTERNKSLSTA